MRIIPRRASLRAPSVTVSGTAEGSGDPAGLLFEDDFSSGDLSKATDTFRWGDGTELLGPGSGQIDSVTGPLGGTINAMRFTYGTFQEVRFALTESLEEERAEPDSPSDVAHPDLWTRFDLFIPTNYHHFNVGPGQVNDKWFVVYKNAYLQSSSGVANFFEMVPDGDSGDSLCTYTDSAVGGLARDWDFINIPELEQGENDQVFAVRKVEAGTWIDFCFRCKVPTNASSNDGLIHCYKNGVLAWGVSHGFYDPENDPAKAGFDRGYLMGYHNSEIQSGGNQTWYLANFRIGTTAASVGITE